MTETIIIGGGAAGLFCAAECADPQHRVTVLEKNDRFGKKLYITGKGRCNFTNDCTKEELLGNVVTNARFLYSAVSAFDCRDTMTLFEKWGLSSKVERGNRVFPVSDHASDVIRMLERAAVRAGATLVTHTEVQKVRKDADGRWHVHCVRNGTEQILSADQVVIATGGLSYPSTGSTGDGYRFARETGHRVTDCRPSLVPIVCADACCQRLQGLSLKNVSFHIREGKKKRYDGFGEMMFTHFGITGPLVLSASALAGERIGKADLRSWIDLKPALTEETLDARFVRIFQGAPNKELKNVLGEVYPAKLVPVIPELSGVNPEKKNCDITKKERAALVRITKTFPLTLTALRGYTEAVITQGGVSVRDVDPHTMESKKADGLYLIGEVLDLDALTGGFNLQIAWSTAHAAAESIRAKAAHT